MMEPDLERSSGSGSFFSSGLREFFQHVAAPVSLFIGLYLLFFSVTLFLPTESPAAYHGAGLLSALLATVSTNRLQDGGQWRIGFGGGLGTALRESAIGLVFATAVIAAGDALILATTGFEHRLGNGIDFPVLLTLFIPAAIHEEVLFRGYPFQKIARWNRTAATIGCSAVFTFLHLPNPGITPLALLNIFLAGVMLSCAYFVFRRLWFPVAVHVWWNILTGPVLGHEVSGFQLPSTLLTEHDPGPAPLTGGRFGFEGSIWTTVVEVLATLVLLRILRNRGAEEP
jgi:membrane protease YdiL (CAAX protease family)